MKNYLKFKNGHCDPTIVEAIKKFDIKAENAYIKFDGVKLQQCLKIVRGACPGCYIDKGTYAIGRKTNTIADTLSNKKFWRVINHLGDAIISIGHWHDEPVISSYDPYDEMYTRSVRVCKKLWERQ